MGIITFDKESFLKGKPFTSCAYTLHVAGPEGGAVKCVDLRPLACWDWGFRSRRGWMFFCCECCVLSGRGFCDELITRTEEPYRLWCVVVCDVEISSMRRRWHAFACNVTDIYIYIYICVCVCVCVCVCIDLFISHRLIYFLLFFLPMFWSRV
jgi:hypothetical protein